MTPQHGSTHQHTTLVCSNLGTITDPKRKREGNRVTVTFTTFDMPDLGVDIIKRVTNAMKRQLTLSRIQVGNGTMMIRVNIQGIRHNEVTAHVTKVINDLFDALRNADAKVPAGMTSFPSPRQRPQRRVPTGRRRR